MNDASPLIAAQQQFSDALPFRILDSEICQMSDALERTLYDDLVAPADMPPYPRAIVEGFLVHTADTQAASESSPVSFKVVGEIKPGDKECPAIQKGQALRVSTGSIVANGPLSVVRMWEAQSQGDSFTITRAFPPRCVVAKMSHPAGACSDDSRLV